MCNLWMKYGQQHPSVLHAVNTDLLRADDCFQKLYFSLRTFPLFHQRIMLLGRNTSAFSVCLHKFFVLL